MKIVIFGGSDVESTEARRVAVSAGLLTATATFGGVPVHNGNAYKADGFQTDFDSVETVDGVIIFECNPACAGSLKVVARCDHHNPGDPGFGFPPELYYEGSSLGQLLMHLGLEPTERQLLICASDHCPADAYLGRCQLITPEVFRHHRLSEKAAFYATQPKLAYKADVEVLEAIIARGIIKIQSAPMLEGGVRDLRATGFVEELPEAALRSGEAYVTEIDEVDREQKKTGNRKILIGGHTTPKVVQDFMSWAATLPNIIGKPYGDPVRGFAGVIVKP